MARRIFACLCIAVLCMVASGCSLQRDTFEIYYNPPQSTIATTNVSAEATAPTAESNENRVWISTKSGTKYHKVPDCSGITESKQISVEEAEAQNYLPCKRCYKNNE